jgi:hypothetical protein
LTIARRWLKQAQFTLRLKSLLNLPQGAFTQCDTKHLGRTIHSMIYLPGERLHRRMLTVGYHEPYGEREYRKSDNTCDYFYVHFFPIITLSIIAPSIIDKGNSL